jgi:hypothetical protein
VLDPFGAEAPVLLCVPILVLITELVEMSSEDLMELILAARNITRAGYLITAEAMYEPQISAVEPGRWVEVTGR